MNISELNAFSELRWSEAQKKDSSEKHAGTQEEALAVFAMKATQKKIELRTEVEKEFYNSYKFEATSVTTSLLCNMPQI